MVGSAGAQEPGRSTRPTAQSERCWRTGKHRRRTGASVDAIGREHGQREVRRQENAPGGRALFLPVGHRWAPLPEGGWEDSHRGGGEQQRARHAEGAECVLEVGRAGRTAAAPTKYEAKRLERHSGGQGADDADMTRTRKGWPRALASESVLDVGCQPSAAKARREKARP